MKYFFCLALFTCFLSSSTNAQMQIGFHYNIRSKGKLVYPVYYTYNDTARTQFLKVTSITTHLYAPGVIKDSSYIDSSGSVPVINILHPPVTLCQSPLKGSITQLDKDESGRLYISFWGMDGTDTTCELEAMINRSNKLGQFYLQVQPQRRLTDITKYIPVHFGVTEIGVATVPFKLRKGFSKDTTVVPSDASASINVGIYIGRKWGSGHFFADKTKSRNAFSFTVGGFAAPAIIPISADNSFPVSDPVLTKQLKAKTNQAGVSFGGLGVFSINDFNFGLYFGVDYAFGPIGKNWYYQGRPWVGFGIGYKLSMLGEK